MHEKLKYIAINEGFCLFSFIFLFYCGIYWDNFLIFAVLFAKICVLFIEWVMENEICEVRNMKAYREMTIAELSTELVNLKAQ